jgi:hypothetical protein
MPMARFREIVFWPMSGHLDQRWTDEPETDVWVRSARRVCELYGEALQAVDLRGPVGSLRFMTFPADDQVDAVRAEVLLDPPDGWETGGVRVPPSIVQLSTAARGRLVVDVIHDALTELARHRDWPLETLAAIRENVLSRHLRFEWASPWKSSPDRRLQARASFRLGDDGYGRVALEIRDRKTEQLLARSAEALAYTTVVGFKRIAATLTWSDGAVDVVPYLDLLGRPRGRLRLDPTMGVSPLLPLDPDDEPEGPALPLTVTGTWTIPDEPSIRIVGGGPTNGVPDAYLDALDDFLERVEDDYLAWWSEADRRQLEIWYVFEAGPERPTTRRTKDKLIARIHRDPRSIHAAEDLRELARSDVRDLMEAVRLKAGLGPQPGFDQE